MHAPFQCIHDKCIFEKGQYIIKGNTDTGPVESLGIGLKRIVIPPSLIDTHDPIASENQGRCGQCKSNEVTTDEQFIKTWLPS